LKKLFIILMMVVLVSALVLGGCAQQAPGPTPTPAPAPTPQAKTLKVGIIYGLTGPGSQHQLMERDVTQLCADWLNEKGGITIKGEQYKIELVDEDSKMTPPGAVDAATRLVYEENVKFIIGCVIPVQAHAVSSVTEKNKVLYISTRTDVVSSNEPYTFTSMYNHAGPTPIVYETLLEKYPGVKTIGQIINDETGARAAAEVSQNIAKARGLTMLEPQVHPWEASEFFPEWTKIISQNPDAVDIGLNLPDNTANCIKQGRQLGYIGPMFCPVGGDPHLLQKMVAKDLLTDFIYNVCDVYGPDATPMIKEIVTRWGKSHTDPCDADAPEAWDPLWELAQAMEKAQSLDPTDVKDALENMSTIETSCGIAKLGGAKTFGSNHMIFKPAPVSRFMNGELEFIKWGDVWLP
jgi:branched-chain amino acid transport system substrate-binding protein